MKQMGFIKFHLGFLYQILDSSTKMSFLEVTQREKLTKTPRASFLEPRMGAHNHSGALLRPRGAPFGCCCIGVFFIREKE